MIELKNVSFTYPDGTKALSNMSLNVESGETMLIAGPNGSGKSTVARHLNALYLPDDGSVLVKGVPTHEDESHARLHVGLVFQNPDDQIVGNTVKEDIAFGPENLNLSPSEVEDRVETSLKIMKLNELKEKSPHLLSEGQKKRVAIAGVLAMNPECIVFDELLTGLDLPSQTSLLKKLKNLKELGHTLILLCTTLEEVWQLADRLVIMQNGTIVRKGDPSKIIEDGLENYGIRQPPSSKFSTGKTEKED